jgi:glycosyltransferase involved in cell wall biosynthesis
MTAPLVSIVLPVYNQADHIGAVVREYEEALGKLPHAHEIILAVNGSRDDSLEVCQALAERCPTIRVVGSDTGGWGLGVKMGLAAARGEMLGYTNSARTSAHDLLLLLLYATAYPHVVVKANRKIRERWQRRLGSLIYNLECRSLFDLSTWDINGTPKVFPRSFDKLLNLTRDDDLIDLEFIAVCRREGYPIIEVPIFSSRRHGGTSTTNYRSALRMYRRAYRLRRSFGRA